MSLFDGIIDDAAWDAAQNALNEKLEGPFLWRQYMTENGNIIMECAPEVETIVLDWLLQCVMPFYVERPHDMAKKRDVDGLPLVRLNTFRVGLPRGWQERVIAAGATFVGYSPQFSDGAWRILVQVEDNVKKGVQRFILDTFTLFRLEFIKN